MDEVKVKRVAIVCVHGVASHPRYEFQDQVSSLFCERLNEAKGTDEWVVDVVNPGNVLPHGSEEPQPTISRVHRRSDDDASSPDGSFFDVIEAYWSPITKGATNWLWVVHWILKMVFVPLNTTASYNAPASKQFFDYGYLGGALVAAFGLFFISLSASWESFISVLDVTGLLKKNSPNQLLVALNSNANVPIAGVPVKIIVWLAVGLVGAFLLGQALSAIWKLIVQRKALTHNPKARWHRGVAISLLVVLGTAMMYAMAVVQFPNGVLGWKGIALIVLIFVAFQLGYALLIGFLVGFFGDVQVYTTRDENDSRFYGMRDQVLDVAVKAMMRAVSPQINGGHRYDRVIVLAHSLGATIAMDALARLYQLSLQGAITAEEFDRIRAFVTAGSSLEKTRYFFDVSGATPTASFEAWRSDAYGTIFTRDRSVLKRPNGDNIFWANYWYFQDPLCNEIRSFLSRPGNRPICWNERGHKHMSIAQPLLHGEYLYDPWFWFSEEKKGKDHIGFLDIITSHVEGVDA